MLNQRGLRGLEYFFKFTKFFKVLPFEWDPNIVTRRGDSSESYLKGGLQLKCTPITLTIHIFAMSSMALGIFHSYFKLLKRCIIPAIDEEDQVNGDEDVTDFVIHLLNAHAQVASIMYQIFCVYKRRDIAHTFNKLLELNQILRLDLGPGIVTPPKNKWLTWENILNLLISLIIPWMICNCIMVLFMFIFDSQSPRYDWFYISGWLDQSDNKYAVYLKYILVVFYAMFDLVSWMQLFAVVANLWFIFFTVYTADVNYWLDILTSNQWNKTYKIADGTLICVIPVRAKLKAYRQIRSLMIIYNDCFSSMAWPFYFICDIVFHTLSAYVTIKYTDKMNLFASCFMATWMSLYVVMEYFVYPIQGALFKKSEYLLQSWVWEWTRQDIKRQDIMIIRALSPCAVRISVLFKIRPGTALTIVNIVANVLLNCLLVF